LVPVKVRNPELPAVSAKKAKTTMTPTKAVSSGRSSSALSREARWTPASSVILAAAEDLTGVLSRLFAR